MDMEHQNFLMEENISEIGNKISNMVKAKLLCRMVKLKKEYGNLVKKQKIDKINNFSNIYSIYSYFKIY